MAKRSSKQPTSDPNVAAFRGMQSLLEKIDPESLPKPKAKSAAAVKRGKAGGAIGGRLRAQKLSAKERAAIAKKAAKARWAKS